MHMQLNQTVEQALKEATSGLLFTSESDEPFEVVHWPNVNDLTKTKMTYICRANPAKEVKLDDLFADLLQVQDWYGAKEKAIVKRYQNLLSVIKEHLTDIRVYRVGKIRVWIYIMGRCGDRDWFGIRTISVET